MIKNIFLKNENILKAYYGLDLIWEKKTGRLPSEYQEVEYLESTGEQYIDTEFKANTTTTRFVGSFTPKVTNVTQGVLGSRNEQTATSTNACNIFISLTSTFRLDWLDGSTSSYSGTISQNNKYNIDITRGLCIINGTVYTSTNKDSINQTSNFLIGNFNGVGVPYLRGFIGYIYACKLYDNNVLVRDFVPCYRKSDKKVGMYDLVTDVFYTNQGTGEFIAGPEISNKDNRLYLFEDGDQYVETTGGWNFYEKPTGSSYNISQNEITINNPVKTGVLWLGCNSLDENILQEYSKLCVSIKSISIQSGGLVPIRIFSDWSSNKINLANINATTTGTTILDISEIQKGQIAIGAYGSYAEIDKIWLEK